MNQTKYANFSFKLPNEWPMEALRDAAAIFNSAPSGEWGKIPVPKWYKDDCVSRFSVPFLEAYGPDRGFLIFMHQRKPLARAMIKDDRVFIRHWGQGQGTDHVANVLHRIMKEYDISQPFVFQALRKDGHLLDIAIHQCTSCGWSKINVSDMVKDGNWQPNGMLSVFASLAPVYAPPGMTREDIDDVIAECANMNPSTEMYRPGAKS